MDILFAFKILWINFNTVTVIFFPNVILFHFNFQKIIRQHWFHINKIVPSFYSAHALKSLSVVN